MPKKALIAEPDDSEARKQAAILSDAGYEAILAGDDDVLRTLEAESPDVIILRHERPGQSGLALVGRIKKQGMANGTSVVLTTTIKDEVYLPVVVK